MTDIFPPEINSPIGRVRKYIPDMVQLENPERPTDPAAYYFSDLEIAGYLYEYAGESTNPSRHQVKRAAADAIEALANNEALVLKKIKTEDLETDGAKVADSLRRGAAALRKQADDEEGEESVMFEVIPFKHFHPQTRLPRSFR